MRYRTDIIEEATRDKPDSFFLLFEGQRITFGQLNEPIRWLVMTYKTFRRKAWTQ
jgi:hypothetical protein